MRRVTLVAATLALLLGACGGSEAGSLDDLAAQIDAIEIPASMTELGELYTEECPSVCPSLVRWYGSTEPVDGVVAQLTDAIARAGLTVDPPSTPGYLTAGNEEYVFFVVTDAQQIDNNTAAPAGTVVEISVQALSEV